MHDAFTIIAVMFVCVCVGVYVRGSVCFMRVGIRGSARPLLSAVLSFRPETVIKTVR